MFESVLIANRGEIAVRVMRTCRALGITTIAVYSEVDADALHVAHADTAVCIGAAPPSESYLNIDRIMDACRQTGAQALHPGYGFLAEQPALARACADAGVAFVGPPPEAMEVLGSKIASRALMTSHGVPLMPGTSTEAWTPESLAAAAEDIGYPLLLKASAGGGGKGMRAVSGPDTLQASYEAAHREAAAAFGDGAIFIEKLLAKPRHIEFQILADHHGHCLHLGERECSIQRRYQKIIEETPSPFLDPELRARMGEVAVNAAQAAGYTNAGTVEFLVDEDRSFYFLEMNARLQVEHPVTEMVTGLDLVRHQLDIAAGEKLSLTQDQVHARGHAIQCRIYAEDPAQGFMPSPGRILALREPRGPGVRVDGGVYPGYTVPLEYDPILAKLIAYGEDRETARQRLLLALRDYAVLGIETSIPYLLAVLAHPEFIAGQTQTDFLPTHFADWKPDRGLEREALVAAALAARLAPTHSTGGGREAPGIASPWETLGAWRQA